MYKIVLLKLYGNTSFSIIFLQNWNIAYHCLLPLHKSKQNRKPAYIFSQISHKFNRLYVQGGIKDVRLYVQGGIKDVRMFESTLANQSFLPRTIKLWNEKLPADIMSEETITTFNQKFRNWVKQDVKI
jgi:hypothetical protein